MTPGNAALLVLGDWLENDVPGEWHAWLCAALDERAAEDEAVNATWGYDLGGEGGCE